MSVKDADLYYISISALQKAVRRSDVETAVAHAKVCHHLEPWRLFCRLWVIAFEDCCRDVAIIRMLYDAKTDYKDFSTLEPLIRAMANGVHSHDTIAMKWLITKMVRWDEDVLSEHLQTSTINVLARLRERYEEPWSSKVYEDLPEPFHHAGMKWIYELADRAVKMEREKLRYGLPLSMAMTGVDKILDNLDASRMVHRYVPYLTLLGGLIPLEAIDMHVRLGKFLIAVLIKREHSSMPHSGMCNKEIFGKLLFWYEGSLLRNYSYNPHNHFWALGQKLFPFHTNEYICPETEMWFHNVGIPEMNKLREWALMKKEPELLERYKALFPEGLTTDPNFGEK